MRTLCSTKLHFWHPLNTDKIKLDIFQNFVAFSEYMNFKEHKIIMANARKVLSRRRKYLAQAWHCHSGFGQTSRLPKVLNFIFITYILFVTSNHQSCFSQLFPRIFLSFRKQKFHWSKTDKNYFLTKQVCCLFQLLKLTKIHGKQNWWFDVTNKKIIDEFIRCFHQIVSRIFLSLSSWKTQQTVQPDFWFADFCCTYFSSDISASIVHPQTVLTWHSFAWTQFCCT